VGCNQSTKSSSAGTRELRLLPDGILRDLRAVVDVGANVGDWSVALLRVSKPEQLVIVEPAPTLQDPLRRRFGHIKDIVLVGSGLASQIGTMDFYLTDDSASSSMLLPRSKMNNYYGHGFQSESVVSIPVTTLDVLTAKMDRVSLVKLDVQGYELEVLKGGIRTLAKCDAVMMEVTFYSHYEGDSSFGVLHQFMAQNGFTLWNLSEPFRVGGAAMWCDAVYHKIGDQGLLSTV
jgi:FkbM family methyltransferase